MNLRNLVLISLGAVALSSPALAAPRDDVMAGISRCNAIADDRVFLDCVYGAAQPLRAELGLPPAPAGQIRLVPPAGRPLALAAPAKPAPRSGGWLGGVLGADSGPALHIAAYSFDRHGMFTVTLSNGQVWQQMGSDIHYAHWKGAPPRAAVSVVEAALGGPNLEIEGEPDPYIVHRLR